MFCLLFLVSSVFIVVGFAGEYISPAPHFLLCAGLSFPAGCVLAARFAGCGRGPSLRCVHLRRTCSSLPASAAAEPCSPFTSAARRIPRFFTGRPSRANHHKYMVGVLGFEPRTSSLSGTRSNQLSYTPILDYRSFSTAESLMVESKGLEPSTSCLQSRCSSH